jgi:plasmid stabilization system protein ParE
MHHIPYTVNPYTVNREPFLDRVEAAIETILQMPNLYAKQYDSFRRVLIRRFPFSIFYTIEKKEIVVHAIFDNRQDPARLP